MWGGQCLLSKDRVEEGAGYIMVSNNSTLIIQDDIWEGSLHLDEVLLGAIPDAVSGAAAFAFATRDGLNAIFGSDEFRKFCSDGHHFDLYIGIDSITDDKTLSFAKRLASDLNGMLNVKVYYSLDRSGIFHAKTSWFKNADGNGCLAFVGSGNLTRSGLQENIEMFSWIEQDERAFKETLNTWNGWVDAARHAGRIRDIDDSEVIARASKNRFSRSAIGGSLDEPERASEIVVNDGEDAVLISQVPKQTGRGWGQFSMSKEFYTDYFGFIDSSEPEPERRVLLYSVDENGVFGEMESRAGIISQKSSNYRIEVAGGHDLNERDSGLHMITFIRTRGRSYIYQICDEESPWCKGLKSFADKHRAGRKGHPKCLVSLDLFKQEFPDHPLAKVVVGETKNQCPTAMQAY